jgi:hypothetical protein
MAVRVAIFGDSYADINGDKESRSWPNLIKRYTKQTHIMGLSGTSIWWSYDNFKNYIQGNKTDCVIFCHTNPYRWPSLPKEIEGQNWNIHSVDNPSVTPLLKDLNRYYLDIFPEELSKFIAKSIFTEINAYCESNGIYLINVFCFDALHIDGCVTSFPIITGLNNVSSHERVRYNDNVFTPIEMVQQFNMFNGDPRVCHMGNKNNMKFALLLLRMANEKTKNTIVDCLRDYSWEQFDESNDKLFKEWLEYYK